MILFEEIDGKPDRRRLSQIKTLYRSIFGQIEEEKFDARIDAAARLLTVLASFKGELVGFKIGYELDPTKFYSWLGGVDRDYRNRGIARELIKRQHAWCLENGFRTVQTKTRNRFKEMLILNLKNGFEITEIYEDKTGETKIVLEKALV